MKTDYDIVICGAGPVGLSVAAQLLQSHYPIDRIAIIDAKSLTSAIEDPRSIALSYGSQQLLTAINAWTAIAPDVTHIEQVHVSRRGHFGRTLIDREDYHLPALGYVAKYGTLVKGISAVIPNEAHILRPVKVLDLNNADDHVAITLSDGRTITTQLVIQAEGGVFGEQDARQKQRDYEQVAIVGHITSRTPVPHRAFERFTEEGPIAFLPQDDGYALVWCVRPEHADKLKNLSDTDFLTQLEQAFGHRIGQLTDITSRFSFPLGLNAKPQSQPRCIAIGNAAQTLHPVAGQGLNLGFRDGYTLAQCILKQPLDDVIPSFEQLRARDRSITVTLTDTLARIFASAKDGSLSQTLLGASLCFVDVVTPAKQLFANQMMFGQR